MSDPTPEQVEQALEVLEAATHETPIAQAVAAHLAKSATRYLDMGPGYLGPTAINGT